MRIIFTILGKSEDNIQDMLNKDRNPKGSRHGMAVLTEDQVKAIRSDPRDGNTIGRVYNISRTHVHRIKKRLSWMCI